MKVEGENSLCEAFLWPLLMNSDKWVWVPAYSLSLLHTYTHMHMYTHTYPNNKEYNFLKNNELSSFLQGDCYGASFKSILHKFVFLFT